MTVAGVPASNSLRVSAALSRVSKLLAYADAQPHAVVARVPDVAATFSRMATLAAERAPFENKINSYKRLDDLCEAWALGDGTIEEDFKAWVPIARQSFDLITKFKSDYVERASREQIEALEDRLHAASARIAAEDEAANAVVVDKRSEFNMRDRTHHVHLLNTPPPSPTPFPPQRSKNKQNRPRKSAWLNLHSKARRWRGRRKPRKLLPRHSLRQSLLLLVSPLRSQFFARVPRSRKSVETTEILLPPLLTHPVLRLPPNRCFSHIIPIMYRFRRRKTKLKRFGITLAFPP